MNRFTPVSWVNNTNIYEVNIRQYTPEGTFNAFAPHLPRLKRMGVHTLWFMPVTPISQKNKKGSLGSYYACSDYTSINPEFGTLDDFKLLVRRAHDMGFRVIIDWVANHTGWDHVWTSTHPEYFKKDPATNDFKMASGMEDIIELDFDNPALRNAMMEAMQFWVSECEIDGFRCDLAFWVPLDFWKEARERLDSTKPLFWLGEFDELERPEYGEAFDASYSWMWMRLTEEYYHQKRAMADLMSLLKRYDDLGDDTMRAWFTTNHDENSWNGTEFEKYGDMAKALAVFSATWNGIPLVYSGQELPNKKRIEFFEKDVIEWQEPLAMEEFYTTILHLHTRNGALRAGDPSVHTYRIKTNQERVMAFLRKRGEEEVLIVLNLSGEEYVVELMSEWVKGVYKNIFNEASFDFSAEQSFRLQGWDFRVYEK